jgi:hypothetical protein
MSQFTHLEKFPLILILLAACGIATAAPGEPALTEITPPEHLGMVKRSCGKCAITRSRTACPEPTRNRPPCLCTPTW